MIFFFALLRSFKGKEFINCVFSHNVTKIQTTKTVDSPGILLSWCIRAAWNTPDGFLALGVLGFVIDYDWISKLLGDAVFTWPPRERAVLLVKKGIYFGAFGYMNSSCFCSKTQWYMFLLVSCHHVGTHPDVHQHGVSIQIFIKFG